jgi:hypothetical protein
MMEPLVPQAALAGSRLLGVTTSVAGVVLALQCHVTVTGTSPSSPEKVTLPLTPLLEQGSDPIATETFLPGVSVPLAGLNVTPLRLLLADQLSGPCEVLVSPTLTVQL